MDFPRSVTFEEGMDVVQRTTNQLLDYLQDGVTADNQKKLFTNTEFMAAYTKVYDMSTQKAQKDPGSTDGQNTLSARLYDYHSATIKGFLEEKILPVLRAKDGEYLLREFTRQWETFKILNKWMRRFFMYLDRYHVTHHNLATLSQSGLNAFRDVVFNNISTSVTRAMLRLVEQERNGESVEQSLLSRCIEVYKAMEPKELKAYEKDFEAAFKEESRLYYLKKAQEWIQTDSTPQYLVKAEQAIHSEMARVNNYLIASTEGKIKRIVVDTLLKEQETTLLERENSGMKALLREDRKDDLARVFRMFKEIDNDEGLPPVANILQAHIIHEGKLVLDKRQASLEEGDAKESLTDPKFITELLDLHEKYYRLVHDQFQGNNHFQKALKTSFEQTVNTDIGKHSNAELLSTYADSVLKTGGSEEKLTESQIEDVLEKVVQLFSFLLDKDVFADVYRNHLAKRLLNQRSVSEDSEKTMIQKLKLKCGAFFTSKMEGMLNDLSLAKDLQQKFIQHVNTAPDRPSVEFTCDVLTTGHWPSYKLINPALPPVFAKCIDVFTAFYNKNTDHRKLTWVHSLGNVTIKANFRQSYDLQVSTLQALVMLVFNQVGDGKESLTFGQVNELIGGLEVEVTKKILHSLSCQKLKVLAKEPDSKKIEETDSFRVATEFQSKIRKVRIPMPSLEDSHNPQRVEEDRGLAIEAAIVRIMKARKRLQHNLLVTEVVNQLRTFKPAPKLIKKKIEHLIEREYLARDETEQNHYKYLA